MDQSTLFVDVACGVDRMRLQAIAQHPRVAPQLVCVHEKGFWDKFDAPPWSLDARPVFALRLTSQRDEPCGFLYLACVEVAGQGRWASFEVALDPCVWGRGVGRAVVEQIPALVWEVYHTRSIRFAVFDDNLRARALYKGLGYVDLRSFWMWTSETTKRRAWEMGTFNFARKKTNKIGFF